MKSIIFRKASIIAHTIRSGLAMVIPVLFIGSVTVLLNSFPVMTYQSFLDSFLGGTFRKIIIMIQYSTVGILALYITAALNISYMKRKSAGKRSVLEFGSLLGCMAGFFILVGFFAGEPDFSLLSGQGVFSALISGLAGSALFWRFEKTLVTQKLVFVDGADSEFNAALHVIVPFLLVTLCFAVFNHVITVCFQVQSLQHLFMKAVDMIFLKMHRSYLSGLIFTSLTSIMWWFGIHGNNVLNQVAEDMFTAIIPGEIVSKSFIDTFVNMGGTGCLIGLLLSLLIFGKRSSTKKLFNMALIPGVFNIGEMMVFGLPVIYNPVMIVPFILSPILSFSTAYILTLTGFLPPVTREVIWTTPALMSGYIATGSVRGMIAQMINIIISVLCYAPFVVYNENHSLDVFAAEMNRLVEVLKKSEETTEEVVLTECEGNVGRLAKHLAAELEDALSASRSVSSVYSTDTSLIMKYQPQFNNKEKCIGAEALLRWEHNLYGNIYPPLVVELAKESGILYELETYIIESSIRDSEAFRKSLGEKFKLSVNVTVTTLNDKRFVPFLQAMADKYKLRSGNICIEITEETALVNNKQTGELLNRIKQFGYTFALDDFSMGHTSLHYLQHNQFDIVKLDGNLVRSVLDNERTREIISSIVYLSKSLNFSVLAEFVDTAQQRDALEEIGCLLYQGYLFGPAVDSDTLISIGNGV